ncbi:PIN/TRAM domain-containing protein, partial [Candidatus Saccharibacteria bacterium]|nr:PIN/TRAM domain-containing protein [Candidatus Saccharibacteria bacterium]
MVSVILQVVSLVLLVSGFWLIWSKVGGQSLPKIGKADDRRKVFIDTSTIMDGRILSVAKTGFLGDHFMIPQSVLKEMQTLADGPDTNKRTRARFGMDVAKELQEISGMRVEIFNDDEMKGGVDGRLVKLAK